MSATQTTFCWTKVSHVKFFYKNQHGQTRAKKPKTPSVFGQDCLYVLMPQVTLPCGTTYPRENMVQRARRRGLLDSWQPIAVVALTANRDLTYTGIRACNIWREWNRQQFAK